MGVPYNNIQRRMKFSLIKALKIGRKYAFQEFYRLIADILLYCQKYNDDQNFFCNKGNNKNLKREFKQLDEIEILYRSRK